MIEFELIEKKCYTEIISKLSENDDFDYWIASMLIIKTLKLAKKAPTNMKLQYDNLVKNVLLLILSFISQNDSKQEHLENKEILLPLISLNG